MPRTCIYVLTLLQEIKELILKIFWYKEVYGYGKQTGKFSFAGNFNQAVNWVSSKVKVINISLCLHCYPPLIIIKEK